MTIQDNPPVHYEYTVKKKYKESEKEMPQGFEECAIRHLDGYADEEDPDNPLIFAEFDSKHLSKNEIQIILNG